MITFHTHGALTGQSWDLLIMYSIVIVIATWTVGMFLIACLPKRWLQWTAGAITLAAMLILPHQVYKAVEPNAPLARESDYVDGLERAVAATDHVDVLGHGTTHMVAAANVDGGPSTWTNLQLAYGDDHGVPHSNSHDCQFFPSAATGDRHNATITGLVRCDADHHVLTPQG